MSNWSNTLGGVVFMATGSVTQSSAGQAMLFPKTDGNLYKKNTSDTEYRILSGSSGTNPIVREYTANDTWTKPTASNFWGIMVYCFGPGGGGGSGRRGSSTSNRGGGAGGAGGGLGVQLIPKASLPNSSYSIVVGTGGAGGAARTTDTTNGQTGGVGGVTSFGNLVSGSGGNSGVTAGGGTTSTVTAGTNTVYLNRAMLYYSGVAGSSGTVGLPSTPASGYPGTGTVASPGGCGGGGISSSGLVTGGSQGGRLNYWNGTAFTLGGGGAAGDATGDRNGGTGSAVMNTLHDLSTTITNALGGGGGGGAGGNATGTVAGGNGGNGGRGAGGGGGGASTNGANSGAGGRGGDGLCVVIEYYGA